MSDPIFRLRPGLRREYLRFRSASPGVHEAYLRAGVAAAYLPRLRLDVPHRMQEAIADSVPTCVSMMLESYGMEMPAAQLATILKTDDLYGTPGRRLEALRAWGVRVDMPRALQVFRDGTVELNRRIATSPARLLYRWEEPWLRYLRAALEQGDPVLLLVDLGRLYPGWRGLAQPHAVVLSGGDGRQAWIQDPSRASGPTRVGLGTLMDSLLPGEPLAAVLRPDSLVLSLQSAGEEGE